MILILGGGLAGMSAAYHVSNEMPREKCVVLERETSAGGLCRSRTIDGFTFDYTGHYLHLRDPETIQFVETLLEGKLAEIERRAEVHTRGVRLPFPFQANLHGLPKDVISRCILDFIRASESESPESSGDMPFGDWARRVFGDAIAEEFMIPFNTKQFGVAADEITAEWVAWAVPRPQLEQVIDGALGRCNEGMGYNPRFRYPRHGGIGVLPAALAKRVEHQMRLDASVASIDARERTVTLESGEVARYDGLISTIPLPSLLSRIEGLDDEGVPLGEIASRLRWSGVIDLQLGIARESVADGTHWIYFPEAEIPFYRVGVPSNVCRELAPSGCSSLSVEFQYTPGAAPPSAEELLRRARPHLERSGILRSDDRIACATTAILDPAYVLFDFDRTPLVREAMRRLERAAILSIGRFGGWTYSYMERALIDGKDAARRFSRDEVGPLVPVA